jgi:hypothetical protein
VNYVRQGRLFVGAMIGPNYRNAHPCSIYKYMYVPGQIVHAAA